jgi:two-component sensor histidine kinase
LRWTNNKKDTVWNGRFQVIQGAVLLRQEKLDSAFLVLEDAKHKIKTKDLPFLYTQLGYVFERRGILDKAADYALKSLQLGKVLNDLKAQALAYSDLSNLFWKQSKFNKGVEFGLKSLKLFEARKIKDMDYDFTLYVVGNNYLGLKNYNKALDFFEQAKGIGEQYGFYNNLSDIYISLTDLYAYLGKHKRANETGKRAVYYADLLHNNFMIMRSWLSIGKLQNLEGNYKNAIASLQKCIKVATKDFGDEYYLNQAYEALAEAYSKLGEFDKAYLALEKYISLKDSIFTAKSDQRISLLQTEFDVALKEETIKHQGIKIKQQHTLQTLISIISGLLLLMLAILFITYRKNKIKNTLLNKQNKEKEFLIKEIHHRVKNNLEIVSSLLALQSVKLKDAKTFSAIQESQNRVLSMSLIHQRLYQGEHLASIEMKAYLINLGEHILDSFGVDNNVSFNCEMDPLELDVDTAVPLGLIVNELLTNSLKYAFPNNKKGNIIIRLEKKDKNRLFLEVLDNGVGADLEKIQGTGFGFQLVHLLTQQLNGKMEKNTSNGYHFKFEFKIDTKPLNGM